MKEAGAHAVKLEGAQIETVKKLVSSGIPVMGHLGLTPQSLHQLGGYRVQGRENPELIIEQAKNLENAGVFAIVLELIPADLAEKIQKSLQIPVIGIGAGPNCDAQVLVWTDLVGLTANSPKFSRKYLNLRAEIATAAKNWSKDVESGEFPNLNETFS
jgi:3-methyl-2-oxobutanoate hydroxymethyltransferase